MSAASVVKKTEYLISVAGGFNGVYAYPRYTIMTPKSVINFCVAMSKYV